MRSESVERAGQIWLNYGCGRRACSRMLGCMTEQSPGQARASSERRPVIVVGYDGSEPSRAAITAAARAAGRRGRVFVVHAYDLPPDFLGSPNYDRLLSEREEHGRALLDAIPLTGSDELLETEYEMELIGGPPAEAIVDVARARDADEIVVGARGLGRVRALLGSVSHELLQIADRPVLVIPAPAVQFVQRNGKP